MKVEQLVDGLGAVYMGILAVLFVTYLTGCGSATGWQFQIGVAPIKAVDNRQQLTQEREYKAQGAIQQAKAGY